MDYGTNNDPIRYFPNTVSFRRMSRRVLGESKWIFLREENLVTMKIYENLSKIQNTRFNRIGTHAVTNTYVWY